MGLFGIGKKNKEKMEHGLQKTRTGFWGNIVNALTGAEITRSPTSSTTIWKSS